MIRQAEAEDRADIIKIWNRCFGDSEAYVGRFLDSLWQPGRCLIYIENGITAAMVHLLPIKIKVSNSFIKSQYLYAAATLPEYRGKGIMRRLIEASDEAGRENGYGFTVTLPAEDGLYQYYGKNGFKEVFTLNRSVLTRDEMNAISTEPALLKIKEPDTDEMIHLRNNRFGNAALWDKQVFSYIIKDWLWNNGEIFLFDGGYAFCKKKENTVVVKEYCGDVKLFQGFCGLLLTRYDNEKFIVFSDSLIKLCGNCETVKYGMIKPLDAGSTALTRARALVQLKNGYFNLGLDE